MYSCCNVYIPCAFLISHQGQENVLKEVKCLSTLSHNNIVRYNSSWKEDAPIESTNSMWKALQELNAES